MSSTLQTILFFYCSILLVNALMSGLYWRRYKDPIVGWTTAIWSGVFLNFLVQGFFQTPGYAILLAFGTYLAVSYSLLRFSEELLTFKFEKRPLFTLSGISAAMSLLTWTVTEDFTLAAFPMAVSIALPMFFTSFLIWKNNIRNHHETRFLAILIALNALHFLDYPFLRFYPDGAILGYSVALFLKICFAISFPAVIIRESASRYQEKLKQEVNVQTRELQSLSAQNATLLNLVCHDLATPVTILRTSIESLKRIDAISQSPDCQKFANRVNNATRSINDILEKVRSLQAVRSGKEHLKLETLPPAPVVEEVIESMRNIAESKNLKIRFTNLLSESESALADRSLLKHQVISNLLSNAIKFSLNGTTIDITLSKRQNKIAIDIVDQGIGIPSNLIEHIFDFDRPTSRPGTANEKGTGFGLPLVKTTLEYMGAEIQVSSRVTSPENELSGSTFTVLLDKAS